MLGNVCEEHSVVSCSQLHSVHINKDVDSGQAGQVKGRLKCCVVSGSSGGRLWCFGAKEKHCVLKHCPFELDKELVKMFSWWFSAQHGKAASFVGRIWAGEGLSLAWAITHSVGQLKCEARDWPQAHV